MIRQVDTFVDFEPVIPVFGATPNDEQLFITALIQGYVTAGLFLLLFLFIMTHQFAVCCGYCPPIQGLLLIYLHHPHTLDFHGMRWLPGSLCQLGSRDLAP